MTFPSSLRPKGQNPLPSSLKPKQQKTQEEPEESNIKSAIRTGLQYPQGRLEVTPPGLLASLIQMIGTGESLDPEEIEHIRMVSEREGIPFDEEKYLKAVKSASESFPTVGNIGRMIEEKTGVPLEAKNRLQKGVRFFGSASKLAPEGYAIRGTNVALPKPVLGAAVEGTREVLLEAGIPEPVANIASFAILHKPPEGSSSIEFSAKTKPSGMKERRFENIKEPREVSPGKLQQITDTVESDFKNIADDIISKSSIEETRNTLKENPAFKNEVRDQFKRVEELSGNIPDKFNVSEVGKTLINRTLKKKGTGFTISEYDKDFKSNIKKILKETPSQEITAKDLVIQYRKNNKELSEIYDPSKSYAANRAKKDAILEHNRAIAEVIQNKFPDTEFSKLFDNTNKQWTKISDAEAIDKFIDGIFDKKIKFEKGKKFFESDNLARPFKRALGEEGFKEFETLMKDLMTTETPYKMLQVAKQKGFSDLFQTAGAFLIHPTLGKLKLGIEGSKRGFKSIMDMLLDKPKYAITYREGIDALKKGKFTEAEHKFDILNKQMENQ